MTGGSSESSVAHQINAERLVLLGWGRAILLQLAHPLVAAGVDAHSTFRGRRWSAAARLHHTVRAMLALTFGDTAGREAALEAIRTIHKRVHGTLPAAAGPFTAGTPYSAEDPELVLWVHATLLESIPLVYDLFVRPLTIAQRDAYCDEAASIAIALGAVPRDVPRTWSAALAYLQQHYAAGTIVVTDQARAVARAVLVPPFARVVAPAAWANRVVTLGLLPPHLRAQYRFAWSSGNQRAFERLVRTIRRVRAVTPASLAWWPEARRRD